MDPLTVGAIFGLGNALLGGISGAVREARQRKMASAMMPYSVWTGVTPQMPESEQALSGALSGLGSGVSMYQKLLEAGAFKPEK